MTTLNDLKEPFHELPFSAGMDLMQERRDLRKISKRPPVKVKRKAAPKKQKAPNIDKLDIKQMDALIAKLEGKDIAKNKPKLPIKGPLSNEQANKLLGGLISSGSMIEKKDDKGKTYYESKEKEE